MFQMSWQQQTLISNSLSPLAMLIKDSQYLLSTTVVPHLDPSCYYNNSTVAHSGH